jgi:hypothetical protein
MHFKIVAAFVAVILLHASLVAQAAAPSYAPKTETTTDVVELSPFTVSTYNDLGYAAENTLAGSRLNTKLRDTDLVQPREFRFTTTYSYLAVTPNRAAHVTSHPFLL